MGEPRCEEGTERVWAGEAALAGEGEIFWRGDLVGETAVAVVGAGGGRLVGLGDGRLEGGGGEVR